MIFSNPAATSRSCVFLVHGFLGGRIQLLPIAASLAREYDILNFSYRSRTQTLRVHSESLIDAVSARLKKGNQTIHFVTHSFGGVVLHHAFANGLQEVIEDNLSETRCVLLAPPLRGAALARTFQRKNIKGPDLFKSAVYTTAKTILGDQAGRELMCNDETWYDKQVGVIPEKVKLLVIAGTLGSLNPLIDGESDGVVAVRETIPNRLFYQKRISLSHNLLVTSPTVISLIYEFLDGNEIGELVHGYHQAQE